MKIPQAPWGERSETQTKLSPRPFGGEGVEQRDGEQRWIAKGHARSALLDPLPEARKQVNRARELRQASTEAEDRAWQLLRDLRQDGLLFRRQQAVGKCIVDFCCLKQRLIIELDGSAHAQPSQQRRDAKRDLRLRALGYRVARFSNGMVLSAPEEFVKRVLQVAL
jgi:very-short-patch-repair endonuclease